jgi:signal transduction histidine kinase
MSLRSAVILVGALLLALFGILSLWLDKTTDLLELEARELAKAHESVSAAEDLKIRLLVHNRSSFLNQLGFDNSREHDGQVERAEIHQYLASARQYLNSPEEAALLEEVTHEIDSYLEARDKLEESALAPVDKYLRVSRDLDKAFASIDRFISINRLQAFAISDEIARQNRNATILAETSFVGGGLLLSGIILATFWLLAGPLIGLGDTIARYSDGDTTARVRVHGLREIRSIGSMFNSMADSLEQRRQDRLRFIASIAHDIRNPLHSIIMAADLLKRRGNAEDRGPAQLIFGQTQNLDRLVGDLLDTTRIEAGQLNLHFSTQDVRPMIRDAVELQRASATIHHLDVKLPDFPLACRCDSARFSQVLNNLLSNAIKYSPNGGSVEVIARQNGTDIEISVSDEGIGIEPDDLENIFTPFKRTPATKGTIPGVGLGLSTSRRIVEAHGGELNVSSVPGRGSTFTIRLPAAVREDALSST